ncbi:Putative fluoride ion transporter CrcB [Moorella glycerini]|uniref:Fluoride-specific ion channel FluC n=2 Tax=Neomoorella TaxID=44260 RepID=A0A9X7J464_9FIRM|nr:MULTISPECIES: fluoride efflux transporter CrcB [Moorella]KYH32966.1 putative fluoride ion transporter CrcB [Moorella mulderi DSM 14980]PRR72771.1 putative fluoride ion transporter CrcB [Moorella stamsii]CEP68116.1 Putative fluoride ion transporter CrcB [Moorella glycerini]
MQYLYVGLGGFLGAITRYALGQALSARSRGNFPTGTLIINLTGAFLLGLLLGTPASAHRFGTSLTLALATGFLGAYTTFSTFSYEVVRLLEDGEVINALTYLLGSIILGLLFALAGRAINLI